MRAAWDRRFCCCDDSVVDEVAGGVDIIPACAKPIAVEFASEETPVGLAVVEGASYLAAAGGVCAFVPEGDEERRMITVHELVGEHSDG